MNFRTFMNMYDNWNENVQVNDNELKPIVNDRVFLVMENRPDLFNKKVVSFGFYDNTLTVRVRDNDEDPDLRTIKITSGMLPEYEIIRTNAPNSVIEEQLRKIIEIEDAGGTVGDPYDVLKSKGYTVAVIGCQDNFDDGEPEVDEWYDYYDVG